MRSTDNVDAPVVSSSQAGMSEGADMMALASLCVEQFDDAVKGLGACEAARVCMQIASLLAERAAYDKAQCWSTDRTVELISLAAKLDRLSQEEL